MYLKYKNKISNICQLRISDFKEFTAIKCLQEYKIRQKVRLQL